MKAKILMINPEMYVYGGAERQLVKLCNYLTEHDYLVTLLSWGKMADEVRRDLKETRIIVTPNIQDAVQVAQAIAPEYNIINPHNHPAEYFSIPRRTPIVWQCNEPPIQILSGVDIPEHEKAAVKEFIRNVVVITDFDKERFKKYYDMDAIINYPGVPEFQPYTDERPVPIDRFGLKGKFVMLQVGMFTFTKNQVKTVEIFNEVKKKIPDAKLVLVGFATDYKDRVDEKINELKLQNDVITLDYLKDDRDIRDIYHFASIHVAPVESQGAWMTSLQSTLAGIPFIVSDKFVASKLVKEHNLGFMAPIDRFAEDIVAIYNNYDQAKDEAIIAGEWIKNNLTWDRFCKQYCEIFDGIYEDKGEMESFSY
jgi:glycosyltransferase involved in cell wall biosynthesis